MPQWRAKNYLFLVPGGFAADVLEVDLHVVQLAHEAPQLNDHGLDVRKLYQLLNTKMKELALLCACCFFSLCALNGDYCLLPALLRVRYFKRAASDDLRTCQNNF